MKYLIILSILYLITIINCKIIIPYNDENIHYIGRIDKIQSPNEYYSFEWSSCRIVLNVTSTTSISLLIDSQHNNWFDVFVNGVLQSKFNVTNSEKDEIEIINNLNTNEINTIIISKITEAEFGAVRIYGIVVDSDKSTLFKYTPITNRKIEYIGDSIATGYCDKGDESKAFTESTEDIDLSFTQLVTNEFNAECNVAAWSGKGVIRNYGSSTPTSNETLPDLYPFILPLSDNSSLWDPSNWIPDLLIINLGANDYTGTPYPTQTEFQNKFIQFIKSILSGYQSSPPKLIFFCGIMIDYEPACQYQSNVAEYFNALYIDMPNIQPGSESTGCYGHPSLSQHAKIANQLIPIIKNLMKW